MLRILAPIMEQVSDKISVSGWHYRVHRYKQYNRRVLRQFGVADIVNTKTQTFGQIIKACSFSFFNFLSSP